VAVVQAEVVVEAVEVAAEAAVGNPLGTAQPLLNGGKRHGAEP